MVESWEDGRRNSKKCVSDRMDSWWIRGGFPMDSRPLRWIRDEMPPKNHEVSVDSTVPSHPFYNIRGEEGDASGGWMEGAGGVLEFYCASVFKFRPASAELHYSLK